MSAFQQQQLQFLGSNFVDDLHMANVDWLNPLTGASFSSNYWALLEERQKLTIWQHKQRFMDMLDNPNIQFILLEAETGSGKTTQIPQWCVEWFRKRQPHSRQMVVCTQPRRLATTTVAKRVAKEMDVQLGKEVGYSIRFDDAVCFQTVLKYCTDGVLLSEATQSNLLIQYGVIILDEVHERSLITDVLMGLVKAIASTRLDLRVVIMSASLNTGNFHEYFAERSTTMKIDGRTHPVDIVYTQTQFSISNFGKCDPEVYWQMAVNKVEDLHKRETEGDILLFMTGEDDIENICEQLRELVFGPNYGNLECFPLYSSLQPEEQHKILSKPPTAKRAGMPIDRRCIVATNIAETSMTIDGVVFVIDPGYCKRKEFDPKRRIESLLIRPITQASAIQRAGRAGRTRPGKCFRLYSKADFERMKRIEPEVRHSNLANVLLRMKKSGVRDLHSFDFMDPPPAELLSQAIAMLTHFDAFDVTGRLTVLGNKMADLPVDPPCARMLIESLRLKCAKEVITIVAMVTSPNSCFIRPNKKKTEADLAKAKFQHDQGDHLTLLRVFNSFAECPIDDRKDWCHRNFLNYNSLQYAADACNQLEDVMRNRLNVDIFASAVQCDPNFMVFNITKALLAGSFMKVAFFKQTGQGNNRRAWQGHYITVESQMPAEQPRTASRRLATGLTRRTTTRGQQQQQVVPLGELESEQQQKVPEYQIHPNSVLFSSKVYRMMRPEWILYESAIQLRGGKHYLRNVSNIRAEWLMELAPKYYAHATAVCPELHQRISSSLATDANTIAGMLESGARI